ncbi:MAG TPA: type II toxin-antitoxin system HicA family toxin [Candidatus Acidoferrales bacterium]
MSEALPRQLRWREFTAVLRKLGYELHKSNKGSARTFRNLNRQPPFVTFHEPHGSDTLRKGTLREYIRKLGLSHAEFLQLLD